MVVVVVVVAVWWWWIHDVVNKRNLIANQAFSNGSCEEQLKLGLKFCNLEQCKYEPSE